MSGHAPTNGTSPPAAGGRLGVGILLASGGIAFFGAGALFWNRYGESVFADIVSAALAWCM